MPQLARAHPALRHAAMAIGALSIGRRHNHGRVDQNEIPSILRVTCDEVEYAHATTCYSHSLKLQAHRASFRNAVLLSLLLIIFELLRQQRKSALDHVNHGMALLLSGLGGEQASRNIYNFAPNPRPVLQDVADVYMHLATQTKTILAGRIEKCSPLPNVAKGLRENNMTMESFINLLGHLNPGSATLNRIPATFKDLCEFEEYWTAIRRRVMEIRPLIIDTTYSSDILSLDDEKQVGEKFPALLGNDQVRSFFEECRRIMRRMDTAFMPLFNKDKRLECSSPTYLRALQLRLQFLATYIFDNPPQYLHIESMHMLSPMIREYLSLVEATLRSAKQQLMNSAHQISVECELAWNLLLVALYCRDFGLRESATVLLREYPGQDGLWNTRSLYALAKRNQWLEAVNAMDGSAEEQWERLWRREFVFEEGGSRIVFRYLDRNDTGWWRLVEETAEVCSNVELVEWKRSSTLQSKKLLLPKVRLH
jgi:hypothetical protein